ncbi:MAG: VWA domain-containing protein [Myxococcales bacterium]|nr:VWA domain-containing protein [Myxococcales bacterium]
MSRPTKKLGSWLRRHSLTLVAALGGAAGVAYAAGWHHPAVSPAAAMEVRPSAPVAVTPERDQVQDTVQIALLLDTSSSMDGLINQARAHLWNMVDQMGKMTRVVDGKVRGVKIELALYEYGNDTIPAAQGFIRQVLPFTSDLDSVSEKLHALFTNGGSEFAGQAIQTSVAKLQWSSDPAAMKFIYVAGNEGFDQGPVNAADAMAAAAKSNISVQLIYCGGKEESWEAAAKLAHSDLATIDQNQVAIHVPSPQDADPAPRRRAQQHVHGLWSGGTGGVRASAEGGHVLGEDEPQGCARARAAQEQEGLPERELGRRRCRGEGRQVPRDGER